MYSVKYDPIAGIVRVSLDGFWDIATTEAFGADIVPEFRRARVDRGVALVLSDARNFPVQSAEVGAAFARIETSTGALRDRMAVIVGSALTKMQGQRALEGTTAFFTELDEAERWLRQS